MKYPRAIIPFISVTALIMLGSGVYLNSLAGSFVASDDSLISGDPAIKSWSGIPAAFSRGAHHPLRTVTFMADYSVWGLNPAGYHLTNILLHISAALALYWFISLLVPGRPIPFVISALFMTHPVQAGSVAYVSGRSGPLSALFAILCFIFYIKYVRSGRKEYIIPASCAFILSLLSCENAIVLPALLIVYNYLFDERPGIGLTAVFTATAIAYALLRMEPAKGPISDISMASAKALLSGVPGFFAALAGYCKLLILPASSRVDYGNKIFNLADPAVLAGAAIFIVLLYAVFRVRKFAPPAAFAISWFLIALVPVSGINTAGAFMAESRLYFPSIGFFLACGIFLRSPGANVYLRVAVAIAVVALIWRYSYVTVKKNMNWRDPVVYYASALRSAPDSVKARNDMATAYEKAGMYDEASGIYNGMLKQDPEHPDIYVNLAAVQIIKGNTKEAIVLCGKALSLDADNAAAYNNLAVAYYVEGEYETAIHYCDLAVKCGYNVKQQLLDLLRPYREIEDQDTEEKLQLQTEEEIARAD
ncbi:MAG: tetratricopeptide repeat protein [Candidatus Omnitrophota bacterium]